ncbi:MAG: (d)CMP kinase [Bacteriovoracaceae bacterium]|nr:(d)CMP kinase [Bacteriovoracaceae bacterium]
MFSKTNKKVISKVISIDGPSASGKSSITKSVAQTLNLNHIDSGALYRYLTFKVLEKGEHFHLGANLLLDIWKDNLKIEFRPSFSLFYHGVDQGQFIREHSLSAKTSQLSQNPAVRDSVNQVMRELVQNSSEFCILEGRDIGTVVFPDAAIKFYITASPEVRAKRRYTELKNLNKLGDLSEAQILEDVVARDKADATRPIAPLTCPKDAIMVDTSDLNFDQVLKMVIEKIKAKI